MRYPNRPLRLELLERRRLLASLGIDLRVLQSAGSAPAAAEIAGPILKGTEFWIEVAVQDIRDTGETSQGVIALSLDLAWDNDSIAFQSADNLTVPGGNSLLPLDDRLVTANFPLQRAVDGYDPTVGPFDPSNASPIDTFSLRCVRGGALPELSTANFDGGTAIGVGAEQAFSQLKFVAGADSGSTTFTAHLDGSMSFADAATLDGVVAQGDAVAVPELANTVARTLQIVGGSISGVKFDDLDGNGVRDNGEPTRPGVTIRLTPVTPAGDAIDLVTDTDGAYRFTDLAAGAYTVSEVFAAGELVTVPANNQYDVTLDQQTQSVTDRDFGDFTLVSLSGTKSNIVNGVASPAGGVTIRLDIGNDNDPANDPPTETTDSNGVFVFNNVRPGTHAVIEQVPVGFTPQSPSDGRYVVTTVSGQDQTTLDFRNQQLATGTISGTKFDDTNGDGTRQPTEPGLAGVTIQLDLDNDGTIDLSTLTDADGAFVFSSLPVGTHRVDEVVPDGSVRTTDAPAAIALVADQVVSGLLFGNFTLTSLSGTVFTDSNANAIADTGESLRPGETVTLDLNTDGTIDATATTDANGNYRFENVGPGTHRVQLQVPTGFRVTLPESGSYTIASTSGLARDNLDFGVTAIAQPPRTSSISGMVFNDVNRNAVVDADEVGLPGVTVQLFAAQGTTPLQVQTTAIDGSYRFTDLAAGSYRIVELQPSRFRDVSIGQGMVLPSGEARGNASGINAFDNLVLRENETAIDYNFGEVLGVATKRMVLSKTDVRSEMGSNLNVASQTLRGTPGDDVIRVQRLDDGRVEVTINRDRPVTVAATDTPNLVIDALGGNDTVTIIGSSANEQFRVSPRQAMLVDDQLTVAVFNARSIQIDGGGGSDEAELRDSSSSDTLTASGTEVALRSAVGATIQLDNIGSVVAVSAVDIAPDTADVEAVDIALRLIGDWNEV